MCFFYYRPELFFLIVMNCALTLYFKFIVSLAQVYCKMLLTISFFKKQKQITETTHPIASFIILATILTLKNTHIQCLATLCQLQNYYLLPKSAKFKSHLFRHFTTTYIYTHHHHHHKYKWRLPKTAHPQNNNRNSTSTLLRLL